jgi:ATP-dependent Clp protease ATP-binding subunit ClpC
MKHIVEIELGKVRERLSERGLRLELADDAKQFIIERSKGEGERDHTDYGARPLRRAVEMYIEDPLSEELLRGEFEGKNVIRITVKQVGEEKQLEFTGESVDVPSPKTAEPELVGAGAASEGESATA